MILLEQIRTIDKTRLREKMGHIDDVLMQKVNNAITISFGLDPRESAARETEGAAPQTIA